MTDEELERRYAVGCEILREAGRRALEFYAARDRLAVERKGLQDLVSRADRELESFVRRRIAGEFADDAVLGEEYGGELADRLWIVDPIDGTANFLRGLPYWSLTLAFVAGGHCELAFTYDAVHDELFAARRGQGTFRNGRQVHVSAVDDPRAACVGLSYSFKVPPREYAAMVERLLDAGFDHRRMGSAALGLAHVADGRIDALVTLRTNSWDVLPGLLLVSEAGGLATDYTRGCGLLESRAAAGAARGIAGRIAELSGIAIAGID